MATIGRLVGELRAAEERRVQRIRLLQAVFIPVELTLRFLRWAWRSLGRAVGFLVRLGVLELAWRLGMDVWYYFY